MGAKPLCMYQRNKNQNLIAKALHEHDTIADIDHFRRTTQYHIDVVDLIVASISSEGATNGGAILEVELGNVTELAIKLLRLD